MRERQGVRERESEKLCVREIKMTLLEAVLEDQKAAAEVCVRERERDSQSCRICRGMLPAFMLFVKTNERSGTGSTCTGAPRSKETTPP